MTVTILSLAISLQTQEDLKLNLETNFLEDVKTVSKSNEEINKLPRKSKIRASKNAAKTDKAASKNLPEKMSKKAKVKSQNYEQNKIDINNLPNVDSGTLSRI